MELKEVSQNLWVRPEAVDYVAVVNESDYAETWRVEIGVRGGQRLNNGKIFGTEKDARNYACWVLGQIFKGKG